MKFIIGKKLNMSQVFGEDCYATPVTAIQMEPMAVIRTKTSDTDGYTSTVVGYGVQKESRINKAQRSVGNFRGTMEIRSDNPSLGGFEPGETVTVSGITKGKGFQGVVKRHGFHGGSRTHGQKHSEREPGAIGGGARAGGRVVKGMRMAGRMGGERVTVRGLAVVDVLPEKNLLLIEGAVPGKRGTILEIRG